MLDKNIFRKTEAMLYGYKNLEMDIDFLRLEVKRIKNNYEGCKGLDMSKENTGKTNKFSSVVENEIMYRERELINLEIELNNKQILKEQIDSVVNRMSDDERRLVELRYLNRNTLSWEQIAYIVNLSEIYVRTKLRTKAIEKVGRTIFVDRCKQERFAI